MSDIYVKLDEILQELSNTVYRHGKATRTNTPFHYGEPIKEAKQAIKQLMVDEFEETTKMYYASPTFSEYQAGYNQALDDIRQKLKEWIEGV